MRYKVESPANYGEIHIRTRMNNGGHCGGHHRNEWSDLISSVSEESNSERVNFFDSIGGLGAQLVSISEDDRRRLACCSIASSRCSGSAALDVNWATSVGNLAPVVMCSTLLLPLVELCDWNSSVQAPHSYIPLGGSVVSTSNCGHPSSRTRRDLPPNAENQFESIALESDRTRTAVQCWRPYGDLRTCWLSIPPSWDCWVRNSFRVRFLEHGAFVGGVNVSRFVGLEVMEDAPWQWWWRQWNGTRLSQSVFK